MKDIKNDEIALYRPKTTAKDFQQLKKSSIHFSYNHARSGSQSSQKQPTMYADSYNTKDFWKQFQGKSKAIQGKEDKETKRLREDLERVKKTCLKLGGGDFKVRTKNDQYKTTSVDIIGGGSLEKTVSEEHKRADKAIHEFMKKPNVTIGQHQKIEPTGSSARLPPDNSTSQDAYKWPPKHDYEPVADFKNRNKRMSIPFAGKELKQRFESQRVEPLRPEPQRFKISFQQLANHFELGNQERETPQTESRSQFLNHGGGQTLQQQNLSSLNVKAQLQNKIRVERSNFSLATPKQIRTSSVSPAQLYRSMRASASALASYTVKNEERAKHQQEAETSLEIETKPEEGGLSKTKSLERNNFATCRANVSNREEHSGLLISKLNQ